MDTLSSVTHLYFKYCKAMPRSHSSCSSLCLKRMGSSWSIDTGSISTAFCWPYQSARGKQKAIQFMKGQHLLTHLTHCYRAIYHITGTISAETSFLKIVFFFFSLSSCPLYFVASPIPHPASVCLFPSFVPYQATTQQERPPWILPRVMD